MEYPPIRLLGKHGAYRFLGGNLNSYWLYRHFAIEIKSLDKGEVLRDRQGFKVSTPAGIQKNIGHFLNTSRLFDLFTGHKLIQRLFHGG